MELIKQLMSEGGFDVRDPDMDPKNSQASLDAYTEHSKRKDQAIENWPKVAKALGGTLKIHKLQGVAGHPPFAVIEGIKVEGKLKSARIELGFDRQSQILKIEPEINSRDAELVGVIKHVWKKATGGEQLYSGDVTRNGINIGYFSSMEDKKYQAIIKGIQAVLEVLAEH